MKLFSDEDLSEIKQPIFNKDEVEQISKTADTIYENITKDNDEEKAIELRDKLINIAKDNLTQEPSINFKIIFKSTKKDCKYMMNLDTSIFEPNQLSLLGGSFKEKYTKQLHDIIFNANNINEIVIMELLYYYNKINTNNYPIFLNSKKYRKIVNDIAFILNNFFNENNSTIRGIYIMFNSELDTKKEHISVS